ncbi:Transposon Ty3-I Gag-Pol polyprotein [Araneus ventricosus]|uniref:Transposon Ty3-I Gag-Pol polyprotein n=1 Tax=Araneus ventricosus TaxID=182803 RepID=A0A4Y2VI88_ARAVE|nr:Transposon Ty3-I Gag-Pol polyprotein [Araneus ventricosus]
METFRPPGAINFSCSNLADTWNRWTQKLKNYLIASEKDKKPDGVKIAILLNLLGDEGTDIFNTFKSENGKSVEKFDDVLEMFTNYCIPRRNVVFERFKFFSCSQQEGQQVDNYLTELKTLASTCDFGDQEKGLIRDRVVLGIRDMSLQERLQRESDLTLKKAAEFLRASEASKHQIESVKSASKVHEIQKNRDKNSKGIASYTKNSASNTVFNCQKCGKEHKKLKCPAYGKICSKCKRKNHFAAVCKTVKKNYRSVNNLENDNSSNSGMNLFIDSVTEQNNCSVNQYHKVPLKFVVVNVSSRPILGLSACQKLNLIKKIEQVETISKDSIMDQYSEVFNGLGEFPGKPYHIEIKSEIKPVINAPRRVPQSLHKELEKTLNELVQLGIVSPVNKPTEWVNSLVIVEKPNGKLRICLDPRNLNKAIKREHYVIPSVDEIISRLEGKQCFSVLDLKEGFWQVPLDKDSAELCTFNSPFGRYEFNRLPFGICSAPEVFQKKNQKLYGDIKGVEIYFDDLIIAGKNKEEHDKILVEVLERAKENNIKFNPNKFQFRIEEVKYMGLLVSKDGIKADPSHVRAIKEIEKSTSKNDIKRLLGMVNFLSKFIPNVSAVTSPLRVLLKKDIEFQWNYDQETSFEEIKRLISSTPVLKV